MSALIILFKFKYNVLLKINIYSFEKKREAGKFIVELFNLSDNISIFFWLRVAKKI